VSTEPAGLHRRRPTAKLTHRSWEMLWLRPNGGNGPITGSHGRRGSGATTAEPARAGIDLRRGQATLGGMHRLALSAVSGPGSAFGDRSYVAGAITHHRLPFRLRSRGRQRTARARRAANESAPRSGLIGFTPATQTSVLPQRRCCTTCDSTKTIRRGAPTDPVSKI